MLPLVFGTRALHAFSFVIVLATAGCGKIGYDGSEGLVAPKGSAAGGSSGGVPTESGAVEDHSDSGEAGFSSGEDAGNVAGDAASDAMEEVVMGSVDATVPDARSTCPSIASGGPMTTAMYGAASGGIPYGDICPPGEAIIGYAGSSSNTQTTVVGQLQTICGKLSVAGSPCRIGVSLGTILPARGAGSRMPTWIVYCPMNQIVVGFHGRAGYSGLDALGIDCAPLVVSQTGNDVSRGAVTSTPVEGGPTGPTFEDGCQPDQIAVGSNLRAGQIIYALGLVCAAVSLAP